MHKEIFELHKDWRRDEQDASVRFQIEFLQLNEKDDSKQQPVLLDQICEVTGEMVNPEYSRKRSWVWKYFDRLTNIIYRCNLCNVALSIKGCNSNNMNRHVRTRHPGVYKAEVDKPDDTTKREMDDEFILLGGKRDDNCGKIKDVATSDLMKQRRSWIWSYFNRISSTLAQCKLCNRNICHGGNATSNMNRHLKMVHNKTGGLENHSWIWKLFEKEEKQFACKICHFKCIKFDDVENSIKCILHHLKTEHGVVSSDQIISETEYEIENIA